MGRKWVLRETDSILAEMDTKIAPIRGSGLISSSRETDRLPFLCTHPWEPFPPPQQFDTSVSHNSLPFRLVSFHFCFRE